MNDLKPFPACLCMALGLASAVSSDPPKEQDKARVGQRGPVLYGVSMEFAVRPVEIAHSDRVRITLRLTNVTARPVKFRYSCCIEQHVKLYDAAGEYVHWKDGAPILECPYKQIEIQPGATVEQTEELDFGQYYSVAAGTYEMALEYDRRLMQAVAAGQGAFVQWGQGRVKVRVKE